MEAKMEQLKKIRKIKKEEKRNNLKQKTRN
jgi:hypothetical protein